MRLKVGDIFRNINNGTIIVVTKISAGVDWWHINVYASYITHVSVSRTEIAEAAFDTSILGRYWKLVEI